jgi:uncharacterized GH25 family protein
MNTLRALIVATLLHNHVRADIVPPVANPKLRGRIVDADAKPLSNSTVFIYSAGPRVGSSMFCPTCYPDCRKHAETDANGNFEIKSLDSKLLFRLLVVNKSYKPKFVPRTDPLKSPIEVNLDLRPNTFPDHQALRGRVVTPDGKSLPRAVVSFDFFGGLEANCGGQCEGVDLVAVTDDEGRFTIGSEKKFDWMTVIVEAPGFARRKFFQLSSEKTHDLKLTEGAVVSGRVVKDNKPVAGVAVGLVSVDRSEMFTGNYDTYTDAEGMFHFFNVPPYQMYYVYSLLDQSIGEFVAPASKVRVTGDGTRKDLGDVPLLKGSRLRGKIQLADSQPFPPDMQIFLGRQGAWDSRSISVGADGTFETAGVPVEAYSLGVRVRGYTVSTRNKSLDRLNGGSLVGRIDNDTFLTIVMDRGDFARPDFANGNLGPDMQPYDKPLQGIIADSF